jgi:hypothetical protein
MTQICIHFPVENGTPLFSYFLSSRSVYCGAFQNSPPETELRLLDGADRIDGTGTRQSRGMVPTMTEPDFRVLYRGKLQPFKLQGGGFIAFRLGLRSTWCLLAQRKGIGRL